MNKIERDGELVEVLKAIEQILTLRIGDRLVLGNPFNERQRNLLRDIFKWPKHQRYHYRHKILSTVLFGERLVISTEMISISRQA